MAFKSDRRLCLTRDKSRVVEADDSDAAFLFATPGSEIAESARTRYGLELVEEKIVLPKTKKKSGD